MSLIFSLLVTISIHLVASHCVHKNAGEDLDACTVNDSTTKCCKSLPFLISSLFKQGNILNITVIIQTDSTLDGILNITGFEDLTIQGQNSTISCIQDLRNTGVYIKNVRNMQLLDVTLTQCGMLKKSSTFDLNKADDTIISKNIMCAVYIQDSSDLTIQNIRISNSKGTGMVIYNTKGHVHIDYCTFTENKISNYSQLAGGGGLAIEFTSRKLHNQSLGNSVQNSTYTIENCRFEGNEVQTDSSSPSFIHRKTNDSQGLGRGGGLYIALMGTTKQNKFYIKNCKFINNTASKWGGGMYLSLRNLAERNTIEVNDCEFHNNTSLIGGGGMKLSLISYSSNITNTKIVIKNCNFSANNANKQGGGMQLTSSRDFASSTNCINIEKCTWILNKAALGSAIDINPSSWDVFGNDPFPTPKFTNCTIKENHIIKSCEIMDKGIVKVTKRVSTLFISRFMVEMAGQMMFLDNNSNGIYLESGTLILQRNSSLIFKNNTASMGGGIALHAFSALFISSNSHILFENNEAALKGGAIYVDTKDQHEKIYSQSCFIQKSNDADDDFKNVTITFKGNHAKSNQGNSIYASSLQPCRYDYCTDKVSSNTNIANNLRCIVTFQGLLLEDISTHVDDIFYNDDSDTELNTIIPGKPFQIPVLATDEMNTTINAVYELSLNESNSNITLDGNASSLSYVSNQAIFLNQANNQNENTTLLLVNNEITLSLKVSVIECLPGHVLDAASNQCICDTSKFRGIWKCDREKRVASIINGYWIGPCGNKQCTGFCPLGFCTPNPYTDLTEPIHKIHKLVCNSNREGKLCGRCTANHSVYYHSDSYRCDTESLCKYGILFYILSEILPLTVIFIIIITLNLSFTTGALNGIILYAQILNSFVNVHDMTHFFESKDEAFIKTTIYEAYKAVYEVSNLNYFYTEKLAFCLWKGANTLDIIAWKYVTIIYALFLMTITILILNTTRCKRVFTFWRPQNLRRAVVHGFSAFLVMCYSQCAKISFQLLSATNLVGHNLVLSERVLFYSGDHTGFDPVHIKYGVPAILFALTMVIVPPVIFLLYPIIFKVLALCRLSELKIVTRISNIIPMQLFDSFQSCYKDNFRFFSGLYFIYRLVPLFLFATTMNVTGFYFNLEIFLILALSLNAIFQPYKKHWHNIVDSLIFTNLAMINSITLYIHQKINEGRDKLKTFQNILITLASVQLVLIYMPLIYILAYIAIHFVRWGKKKIKDRRIAWMNNRQETLLDSTYLPPLRSRVSVYPEDSPFYEMK